MSSISSSDCSAADMKYHLIDDDHLLPDGDRPRHEQHHVHVELGPGGPYATPQRPHIRLSDRRLIGRPFSGAQLADERRLDLLGQRWNQPRPFIRFIVVAPNRPNTSPKVDSGLRIMPTRSQR